MNSSRSRVARASFHETPLVLFSGLAIAGAGIGSANLLAGLLGGGWVLSETRAFLLSGLLLLAMIASAGHLGRPLRGPLVLLGVGRSPLSNEILVLGLALASGSLSLLLPEGRWDTIPGLVASVASVLLLMALGGVYALPGQMAWGGASALSPLALGLAWGLLLDAGLPGGAPAAIGTILLWVALLLDGGLTVSRWLSLERYAPGTEITHPQLFHRRKMLLGARFALASMATPLALLAGVWPLAIILFAGAIFLDRLGFYALSFRRTTESEVRRVESLLQP